MELIAIGVDVKHAVDGCICLVDLGVLCMYVVNCFAEISDCGNGVDTLPDEVRGVEVCADDIADGVMRLVGLYTQKPGCISNAIFSMP